MGFKFTAPTLTETFSNTAWRDELEANMADIQSAFTTIQGILDSLDWTTLSSYTGLIIHKVPMTISIAGTVSAGTQPLGFIVGCEGVVYKAYARAGTVPAGGVTIDIRKTDTAGTSVLSSPIVIEDDTSTIIPASALPATDCGLQVGDFLQIVVTETTGGITGMADLQVTLIITPMDYDLYS